MHSCLNLLSLTAKFKTKPALDQSYPPHLTLGEASPASWMPAVLDSPESKLLKDKRVLRPGDEAKCFPLGSPCISAKGNPTPR
jgi:hypothetical protein